VDKSRKFKVMQGSKLFMS